VLELTYVFKLSKSKSETVEYFKLLDYMNSLFIVQLKGIRIKKMWRKKGRAALEKQTVTRSAQIYLKMCDG
jgi:hypothetical protein